MVVRIRGTQQEYYKMLLAQLRIVPPFHTLQYKEIEFLSLLLVKEAKLFNTGLQGEELRKELFGYDSRIELAETMGISGTRLRNIVQTLKDKGLLLRKPTRLSDSFALLRTPQEFIVNFTIVNNTQEEQNGNNQNIQESNSQGTAQS